MVHNSFRQKILTIICFSFTLPLSSLWGAEVFVTRPKECRAGGSVSFWVRCLDSDLWRSALIPLECRVGNVSDVEKYARKDFFVVLLKRFLSEEQDFVCLCILYSILDNVEHKAQREMFKLFGSSHITKLISLLGSEEWELQVYSATILNHVTKRFKRESSLTRFFSAESIKCLLQQHDWFEKNSLTGEQADELFEALENLKEKLPKMYATTVGLLSGPCGEFPS